MVKRVNVYQKRVQKDRLSALNYLGVKVIPVQKIKGSVNRWQDFDRRFRIEDASPDKINSILKAFEQGIIFPPISVYKINDHYYIIDGNHRVAAAKRFGQIDIDAEVFELLPPADSLEHLLWREKSHFELKTGLNLHFSEIGSYRRLAIYLKLYQRQLNHRNGEKIVLKEAVKQWREDIYQPILKLIDHAKMIESFPNHTKDDLFLYILHHQLVKSRLQRRKVDISEAVFDFCSKPGTLTEKIVDIFRSVVLHGKCDHCLKCLQYCPEGLLCFDGEHIKISEKCNGCQKCNNGCTDGNLVLYNQISNDPSSKSIK